MAVAWRKVLTDGDGIAVTSGTQTFAGAKTFSSAVTAGTINNTSMWTANLYNNSSADHGNIKLSSSPNLISFTVGVESGTAALKLDDDDNATFIGTIYANDDIIVGHNQRVYGYNSSASAKKLIGVDASNIVEIDGNGLGSEFGGTATFGALLTNTASTTLRSLGVGKAPSNVDGECVIEKGLYVGNSTASYGQDEIRCEGEVTAYYGSDIALKKNIKPISNPLDKLLSISGYNFDWKAKVIKDRGGEDGFFVRKKDVGILAQEIEKVIPEIVVTRKDGTKAVKYEKIVPLLIESIKELTAKVTRLENGNS